MSTDTPIVWTDAMVAEAADVVYYEVLGDDPQGHPWIEITPSILVDDYNFRRFIESLEERQQYVLSCRLPSNNHTYVQIGGTINVCATRARQLFASVYKKAREWVRDIEHAQDDLQRVIEDALEHLNLTPRAMYCLQRAGVRNVSDVCNMTEDDLLNITNFGPKAIEELKYALAKRGLSLKPS